MPVIDSGLLAITMSMMACCSAVTTGGAWEARAQGFFLYRPRYASPQCSLSARVWQFAHRAIRLATLWSWLLLHGSMCARSSGVGSHRRRNGDELQTRLRAEYRSVLRDGCSHRDLLVGGVSVNLHVDVVLRVLRGDLFGQPPLLPAHPPCPSQHPQSAGHGSRKLPDCVLHGIRHARLKVNNVSDAFLNRWGQDGDLFFNRERIFSGLFRPAAPLEC